MALLLNNLGSYATIEQVWADHPEGGREGDYVVVGGSNYYWDKYSRCWVQSSASPSGSSGSRVVDGDLTVTGDLGVGGDAVINGKLIVNGVEIDPNNMSGGSGSGSSTGQLVYKSIVFKRSVTRPDTPQDGAFDNPVPNGWYDSVPQGTDPIWMSSRYFTNDNKRPAGVNNDNWNIWSAPALMSDTEDFDVEFSNAATTNVPTAPPESESDRAAAGWFDPVRDPSANWSQMNWMATRTRFVNDSGNLTWTGWKIMLIKGEHGEPGSPGSNGDGFRSVYAKTTGATPTITSQGYPPTGNVTWKTSVAALTLNAGDVLWMAEKRCTGGVWGNWSTPIRISGTNGTPGNPGADGADIEFIYKRSNSLPGSSDTAPVSVDEDDAVPTSEGWSDNPQGVDTTHKYEWMCQRTKPAGYNQPWGPWVGPFVWSAYGDTGMDGDGIEYIYRNDLQNANAVIANPSYKYKKASENNPALQQNILIDNYMRGVFLIEGGNPNNSNDWRPDGWDDSMGTDFSWIGGYYNGYGEWIPQGWHDDPVGVNATNKEEYVSVRKCHKGVWSNWSAPSLWAKYSEEHTIEIIDGEWWVDGQNTHIRAEGQNGTGVEIKGTADYLTETQKSGNAAGITGHTLKSLEGITNDANINKTIGDCYVVDYVDVSDSSSANWVRGHIYVFNDSTSPTWSDKWTDLGQFRGEAGTSQYMHIAWATGVTKSNGAVTAVTDFETDYEDLDPAKEYSWMGICVDNNVGDDNNPLHYDWNYIKGVDGAFQEFVYIRTTGETNPGVKNSYASNYKDSHQRTPDSSEFLPQTNESPAREFTDDPMGVGVDPTSHVFYKYEWMSKREKVNGVWNNWSTPALWAVYGEDGKGIESIQDYYMLSMKPKGVTVQNTNAADWVTEYLEPTAELPYLWHYTYYEYSDGSEYTSPCEMIATYSSAKVGENLLNDTDFLSLEAMPAWDHKGDVAGDNVPDPEEHDVEVVAGIGGRNAFSVGYQGSTEAGYIEYLSQVIYSDTVKKIMPDNWYTLSFWLKGTVDTNGNTLSSSKTFRLDLSDLGNIMDTTSGVKMYVNGNELNANASVNFAPAGDGSWTYHTFTFKTQATLTGTLKFRLLMYTRLTHDTIQVCMPKLELGRMATPYNLVNDNGEPYMRTGIWMSGVNYMQGAPGEPFFDVVNFGGSWYRCVRSHTSSSSLTPSNPIFWEAAINFKNIATDVLLAENGAINLLSSNVINLFNGSVKTASINADGHGSYCIYYPNGRKMMEFCHDGYIYYYHDTAQNNVAWKLGYGGTIIKQETTDNWSSIKLAPINFPGADTPSPTPTLNAPLPISVDGTTRHSLTTYYKFVAGSGSQFTTYDSMIFTTGDNRSPQVKVANDELIPDGWYNTTEYGYLNIDSNIYYLTVKRIVNGRIVETREISQYY